VQGCRFKPIGALARGRVAARPLCIHASTVCLAPGGAVVCLCPWATLHASITEGIENIVSIVSNYSINGVSIPVDEGFDSGYLGVFVLNPATSFDPIVE